MMTLLNSLALLLLLARVKCTPVILPETHLTPTESAQAANFTTVQLYNRKRADSPLLQ